MAGFLTLGLSMGGTFLVGFSVLEDRFLGRLELLRSTPLRANSYHVSYVLLAVLQNMLFVLIALLTLHVLGLSKLGATMLFAGVLSAIAAGAAVGGLAILVGTWVPHLQEGNAILSLVALVPATFESDPVRGILATETAVVPHTASPVYTHRRDVPFVDQRGASVPFELASHGRSSDGLLCGDGSLRWAAGDVGSVPQNQARLGDLRARACGGSACGGSVRLC